MGEVYDFFLSSYANYSKVDIVLEFLAFWFGIISVVFAKKQNILVYPTGIICTIITMSGITDESILNGSNHLPSAPSNLDVSFKAPPIWWGFFFPPSYTALAYVLHLRRR